MASSTGFALSHRTTPLNCAAARPRRFGLDLAADTVISLAQGDFVINRSTSSADHSDGSFLFQNSESPARKRVVAAKSRIPRRVNTASSWIIATSKCVGRGDGTRGLQLPTAGPAAQANLCP